jgi:hypothetical protein
MNWNPIIDSRSVRTFTGLLGLFVIALFGLASPRAAASDLAWQLLLPMWSTVDVGDPIPDSLINSWRSKSLKCTGVKGRYDSFPVKAPDENNPCNDGDMTLFNGILCAVGIQDGCVAVKEAQDVNGRWYRSPRVRVFNHDNCASAGFGGKGNAETCMNTLSPDMGLGIMLYVMTQRDFNSFKRWASWLEKNANTTRVCFPGCNCQIEVAWPRVCNNDYGNNEPVAPSCPVVGHCTLRPGDSLDYDLVAHASGTTWLNNMTAFVTRSNGILPPYYVSWASGTDSPGFPLHLDALRVLLRMIERNPSLRSPNLPDLPDPSVIARLDWASVADADPRALHDTALLITSRDTWNPFFALLAYGPTKAVRQKVIDSCPASGDDLSKRDQWIFERAGTDVDNNTKANSMGWDCMFLATLFNRMRVKQDFTTEALDKFGKALDPMNAAISGLSLGVQGAQQAVDASTQTIDQLQKWFDDANAFLTSGYNAAKAANSGLLRAAQNAANTLPGQIAKNSGAAAAKQLAIAAVQPQQVCLIGPPINQGCKQNPLIPPLQAALGALLQTGAAFTQQLAQATKQVTDATNALNNLDQQRNDYLKALASKQNQQTLDAARKALVDQKKKLQTLQSQLSTAQARQQHVSFYVQLWKGELNTPPHAK